METIRAIRNEADYKHALARIETLMDAPLGSAKGQALDVLVDLVELYESKHVPMRAPTTIAAIEFRMEQANLTPRDLIPFIGSRSKVSEILSGKRALTMAMARALHDHLGIPAEVLLQADKVPASQEVEWERFPIKEMAKLGWISRSRAARRGAKDIVGELIQRAGGGSAALYRKNDHARANAKTDSYALQAWCWRVLAIANEHRPSVRYVRGTVTLDFLRKLARLSWSEDGPRSALEFLAAHGIALVILPHLSKTHLDGAALELPDGTPVIGLTLRYDRVDSFWFCLFHELAHVGRHFDEGGDLSFFDDLSLRDAPGGHSDPKESQADDWAEEALVPATAWKNSEARKNPTPMAVATLANQLQVHPAIIAGKIRHERKNYRLLSHYVGTGKVRRLFEKTSKD